MTKILSNVYDSCVHAWSFSPTPGLSESEKAIQNCVKRTTRIATIAILAFVGTILAPQLQLSLMTIKILSHISYAALIGMALPSLVLALQIILGTAKPTLLTKSYASIDISKALIDELHNPSTSVARKKAIAEQIFAQPGSYNPVLLRIAGIEYLTTKEIEKAAFLCVVALLRAEIDIRLSRDVSVEGVSAFFSTPIEEAKQRYLETEQERQRWETTYAKAVKDTETWDRSTPRNYDTDWIRLHSVNALGGGTFTVVDEQRKTKIIERFYRETQGEFADEDFDDISRKDTYFFDRQTRIFYSKDPALSFTVPPQFTPVLGRWGKLETCFLLPHDAALYIVSGWWSQPQSFERVYQSATKKAGPDEPLQRLTVNNGIPIFRRRYFQDDYIMNEFHFVNGKNYGTFKLRCQRADESARLAELHQLLDSLKLETT